MTSKQLSRAGLAAVLAVMLAGCSGDDPSGSNYDPVIPTEWSSIVLNPYFQMIPGNRWEYRGDTDEGEETVIVEVLDETRQIQGVVATVVRDRVYLDGELTEDTYDWFAQDETGNVWYLGEDSKEIENGEVVSTEGSWEWGVDDALPGIIMWADPAAHVGEAYRQEFYEGEAEDWGKVVAVNQTVTVPAGTYSGCITIEEWNGLESGGHENKSYNNPVGVVLETGSGGGERLELVTFSSRLD